MSQQIYEVVAWVEAEVIHADGTKDSDELTEEENEETETKES